MNRRRQERGRPASAPEDVPVDVYAAAAARVARSRRPGVELQPMRASIQAGLLPLARFDLTAHLRTRPGDPDALHLLARVARLQDRPEEAISLLERSIAAAPDFDAARFELANLLFDAERHAETLRHVDALLQRDPANPAFLLQRANVLEFMGDAPAALDACLTLAQQFPQHPPTWVRLGHAYRAAGQRAKAIESYRHALALRPAQGRAWWALADLKTFRFDDADIAAMQAQVEDTRLATEDRMPMTYALAKALEDRGDYRASFERYAAGCIASRATIEVDLEPLRAAVARNKSLLTRRFFEERAASGAGHPSKEAIFILGRPRSGSTLVEQILASHPAIEATSELRYVERIAADLVPGNAPALPAQGLDALLKLDATQLAALGQRYLDEAAIHRRLDRPHFTDKRPNNWLHVGLIHLMLPHAKIVDVRRHPAASCFSSFKSHTMLGALTLPELGRYYRYYVELMDHFDDVLPGRILRVHFEDLVADPERQIRRLLDYLELPFEPACLRFHETPRSIVTPSSEQVRRPITSESVDHWRHFEPWLGPLFESLGSALTDYPVGARA